MTPILDQIRLNLLVEQFISQARLDKAKVAKAITKKTLDPFIFAIEFGENGTHSWEQSAATQALRKARESRIGDLHEDLFGLVPGWEVMPRRNAEPDLICHERKLIVELKSRQDTVKGSNLKDVYDDLLNNVNGRYRGYTGIFAYWLNKSRKHMEKPIAFTPPDNKTRQSRPSDARIIQMDGRLLWAIASTPKQNLEGPYERPNAIFEVYEQVFQTIDRLSDMGISDDAMTALKNLALQNFKL
jgi:hypothetical protein